MLTKGNLYTGVFLRVSRNERKKKILKAVIDDDINYAEPIGSRHIAKNHDLSLSSATIRNELSALESMGCTKQSCVRHADG